MDEFIEILIKKLQEIVNQNAQDKLNQYQDTTNKNLRRHRNN
jgi:hypothetical protein